MHFFGMLSSVALNDLYVARNVALNAVAPIALRAFPARGSLGADGKPAQVDRLLQRLQLGVDALQLNGFGDVLELGPGRTPQVLRSLLERGARSALGVDVNLGFKSETDRLGSLIHQEYGGPFRTYGRSAPQARRAMRTIRL